MGPLALEPRTYGLWNLPRGLSPSAKRWHLAIGFLPGDRQGQHYRSETSVFFLRLTVEATVNRSHSTPSPNICDPVQPGLRFCKRVGVMTHPSTEQMSRQTKISLAVGVCMLVRPSVFRPQLGLLPRLTDAGVFGFIFGR